MTEQIPTDGIDGLPAGLSDLLFQGAQPLQVTPFDNTGRSAVFKPFQLMLKADAWRAVDSLPGGAPGRLRIGVHFQDGTAEQHEMVRAIASEWSASEAAPVDFVFGSDSTRHIRVRFNPRSKNEAGQWSYVGRRAKRYGASEPTLMLEKCTRSTILHEFGHALGLRHEQSHPFSNLDWNRQAVYRYYADHYQWARPRVDSQIFKVYSASYMCKGAPDFDHSSVMIYPIKPEFLNSGTGIALNDHLSSGDKACVNRMYGA
ncbi:M12 family metallopeptidase [Rhizobium johnstonii]|uniref:M12 family metallopeptidase n=1 Tax=Rhizobium TaxID=379 RepID=UPI0013EF35A1|nr:M12 family metallopeptidase [Rhizobium leguminosarum]